MIPLSAASMISSARSAACGFSIFAISGMSAPRSFERRLDLLEVGRPADERDGEQVDAVLAGEVDPGLVRGAGLGQVGVRAGQVHPLVGADRAAGLDLADDLAARDRDDPQPHPAVGEEDRVALVDRLREAVPLHREQLARCRASRSSRRASRTVEPEWRTATSPSRSPRRSFGPGQVAEDPDLTADLLARRADPAHGLGVLLRRAVGEVEPEDVDAGLEQLTQHLRVALAGPMVATILVRRALSEGAPPGATRLCSEEAIRTAPRAGSGERLGGAAQRRGDRPRRRLVRRRRPLLELLDRRDAPDDARQHQPGGGREQRQEELAAAHPGQVEEVARPAGTARTSA